MKRFCPYFLVLLFASNTATAEGIVLWETPESPLERRVATLERIAEQMAKHYIASKYPASKPRPKTAADYPPKPRLSVPVVTYRTETRYRQVPYTVKMCQNGRCWFETRYMQQAYTVQVPVASSQYVEPEAASTPMADVTRILDLLAPQPGETFVDYGCGADARFVIEAVRRFRCKGLGIEIDAERAAAAQRAVDASGLGSRIRIVHGDSTKLIVTADVGVAYLYSDTLAKLVPNIQRLKRFASYQHPITGLPMREPVKDIYVWTRPTPQAFYYQQPARRYAVWNGYQYSGRLCSNPRCSMCASIQRQLGW